MVGRDPSGLEGGRDLDVLHRAFSFPSYTVGWKKVFALNAVSPLPLDRVIDKHLVKFTIPGDRVKVSMHGKFLPYRKW